MRSACDCMRASVKRFVLSPPARAPAAPSCRGHTGAPQARLDPPPRTALRRRLVSILHPGRPCAAGSSRSSTPDALAKLGRSNTLSVIYDMHDQSVERGESSSQRQAQGAFFTPSSFSSLCWLPTTTPSSSRCAKRGACRSALPRPPIRISSVFVPQILRDAPLGSRAKRRTAAS